MVLKTQHELPARYPGLVADQCLEQTCEEQGHVCQGGLWRPSEAGIAQELVSGSELEDSCGPHASHPHSTLVH